MRARQANAMWLVVFALLVAATAFVGAQFMPDAWYAALQKPSWNPPNWVFAPVWTTLYVLIAIAGWLASRTPAATTLVAIWLIGLVFNAAWSWLFFGRHAIGAALVDVIVLWWSIAAFIVVGWRYSQAASLLFVPYLLWVSFATALNAAIWQLNR